jgi:hypothetical protein
MKTDIEPKAGSWILLVGPRSLNTTMLNAVALLGDGGPVRIVDGGNRFNAYKVTRAVRGRPEVLNRITISRAFTCYQVLSLLENIPVIPIPFVVLDLLSTFYDESVRIGERKRLLRNCIKHLDRLVGASMPQGTRTTNGGWKPNRLACGVVSIHPPRVLSPHTVELLEMLQTSTEDTYFIQQAALAPEPMKLFQ